MHLGGTPNETWGRVGTTLEGGRFWWGSARFRVKNDHSGVLAGGPTLAEEQRSVGWLLWPTELSEF